MSSDEIMSHVDQIRCRNFQCRDTLSGAHSQLNVNVHESDDSLNADVGSCSEKALSGCAEVINLSLSSEPSRAEMVGRRMSVSDSSSHAGTSTRVDDRSVVDETSDGVGGDHDGKRVYSARKLYYRRREVIRPDAVPVYRLPQVAPSITW